MRGTHSRLWLWQTSSYSEVEQAEVVLMVDDLWGGPSVQVQSLLFPSLGVLCRVLSCHSTEADSYFSQQTFSSNIIAHNTELYYYL